jgi:diguanylate cyclase (GGDEF)-like protein
MGQRLGPVPRPRRFFEEDGPVDGVMALGAIISHLMRLSGLGLIGTQNGQRTVACLQACAIGLGVILTAGLATQSHPLSVLLHHGFTPLGGDEQSAPHSALGASLALDSPAAIVALLLLAVATASRPGSSLVWRCCAFCAAGIAAMAMIAPLANFVLATAIIEANRWLGVKHPALPTGLSEATTWVATLCLALGQALTLCRAAAGRFFVVMAALFFLLPLACVAVGLAPFHGAVAALFGAAGLSLTTAAFLSGSFRALDTSHGTLPEPIGVLPHPSRTDLLTGLLTRANFDRWTASRAVSTKAAAMLLIDIDRFRAANHVLGNKAADAILAQVAHRLQVIAAPYVVGRTGGDEFAVFCHPIEQGDAQTLAQRLVDAMATPFPLPDGRQFYLTASVGVAHGDTDGVGDLRDAADEAVYIAKNQGGNQSVLFVHALHEARVERIGLEQDLYRAFLAQDELFLAYQPIISLRDQTVIAVEALARWQHPRAGLVPPSRFVSIAEAAGLFSGLGAKIRELAVAQVARWRDSGVTDLPVINLNVSPLELAHSDVAGTLRDLVDRYGLPRDAFCLEVTEGAFADEHATRALHAAREAGFKVAMDDFGVGYSSLAQLPKLPLTSLKLDRAFLRRALESDDGASLFATIVQLAHVLKLPVVAEGVETSEELAVASDCGCDSVQGFFFARPLSPAQLELCLRRSAAHPGELRLAWPPPAAEIA